jgi:hypothetical protein
VLGFGDSAGVEGAVAVADAGTGVEDATGTGEEDVGGAPTLTGCAPGLPTGAWAKAVGVKKLRALRIKNALFISNVTLIRRVPVISSRIKNDSSVPRVKDKNVAAATHSPSLHTLRRGDVFRDGYARVVYTFGVRFYREVRIRRNRQRDIPVARARCQTSEFSIERNRAIARARVDLSLKACDPNLSITGINLQLSSAIGDFDRAITRTQSDFTRNAFQVQLAIL